MAAAPTSLITNQDVDPSDTGAPPLASWTADQLRTSLLGQRHDLVYLAGHFSANNLLAADYATTVNATELAASSVNLTNSVVLSAGCHSGYTIVDGDAVPNVTQPLDWIQAFAQKRATLIAGTGYQYGDTDFLEYSERLYRECRAGVPLRDGLGQRRRRARVREAALPRPTPPRSAGSTRRRCSRRRSTACRCSASTCRREGTSCRRRARRSSRATTPVTTDPGSTLGLSFADVTRSPDA